MPVYPEGQFEPTGGVVGAGGSVGAVVGDDAWRTGDWEGAAEDGAV